MVKKIKVINLIEDEIPKTEAEELNTIVEEMANETTVAIVEPNIVEPIEPVIMKKKKPTKTKTAVVKVIPEKIS